MAARRNLCGTFEPLLAARLFHDLDPAQEQALDAHLAECPRCRTTFAELQEVLVAAGRPQRPEMPAHFWAGYWDRLVARMDREPLPRQAWWQRLAVTLRPRWSPLAQLAVAATVLVVGIVLGRYFRTEPAAPLATAPVVGPTATLPEELQVRSAQWLERSKVLLLGFVNDDFTGVGPVDLAPQRQLSRELITTARALRAELPSSPNQQLRLLIDQLELVLLQIANLEREHDLESVELVREGISREGLLLKINIETLAREAPTGGAAEEL